MSDKKLQEQYPPLINFKANEPIFSNDFNELQSALLKALQEHTHKPQEEITIPLQKTQGIAENKKTKISSVPYIYMQSYATEILSPETKKGYTTYTIDKINNPFKTKDIEVDVSVIPLEIEFSNVPCKYSIEIANIEAKEEQIKIVVQTINQNSKYIRIGVIVKIAPKTT